MVVLGREASGRGHNCRRRTKVSSGACYFGLEVSAGAPVPHQSASINQWVPLDDERLPRFSFKGTGGKGRLTHQLFRFPAKFHAPVARVPQLMGI